jgi:hypothetical protein
MNRTPTNPRLIGRWREAPDEGPRSRQDQRLARTLIRLLPCTAQNRVTRGYFVSAETTGKSMKLA